MNADDWWMAHLNQDDPTTPSYGHPELRSADLAYFWPGGRGVTITLLQKKRLNADDPTTPSYGHPELRSAYLAYFWPGGGELQIPCCGKLIEFN